MGIFQIYLNEIATSVKKTEKFHQLDYRKFYTNTPSNLSMFPSHIVHYRLHKAYLPPPILM